MRIRGIEALAGGSGAPEQPAQDTQAAGALSRRSFLKLSGLAGGGFALGIAGVAGSAQAQGAAKAVPAPQAFLRIAPDNMVTIAVNRLEFGQGVHTALPMALAEELDVDWKNVASVLAPAGDAYKDPAFGIQMTGGSTALNHSFTQYRELGARARAMLITAAAQKWKVDPASCTAQLGVVTSGSNRATYGELAAAAMELPVPKEVKLKDPAQFRIVGKPTARLDAASKLHGDGVFGMDVSLKGMKVAVVARPPRFGGKVKSFNADKARKVKGVADVLLVDVDRGGTGVAVIADGYWPAKTAREALEIVWEDAGSTVSTAALFDQYSKLSTQPGIMARPFEGGSIDSALAGAAKVIDAEYRVPYLAHAPMEPLNCTLQPEVAGKQINAVKVWVGSQFQTIDQGAIARTLKLAPEKVTLNTMMAGGGFGRRAVPTSDYLVEAANVLRVWVASGHTEPVKVMWSREDDIKGGYYRPLHVHRARIGVDAQGKVVGWQHTIVGQSIITGTPFEPMMVKNGVDATMTEGIVENDYDVPLQVQVHHPKVDVPVLWWRSVGNTHTAFVKETLADEMATAAKKDPVAWRMAQLDEKKHARHRAALQLAVDRSGYGKKKLPKGHAWGVAVHESFGSVVAYVVDVSLVKGEPRVHRVTAGVHANRVVNPLGAEAQIQGGCIFGLAMTRPGFAIEIENGAVKNSNFPDYPPPRMPDAPMVDVFFVPSDDNPTGLGEPGTPGIAPAVANALFRLTGQRQRQLPFVLT
ncbi:xanthine dehydrogenase family protein molybdopterin-binding subunit [Cupriavidus sp. SW-Y-13]|uniref:xanthine dehydrogenase family protein molybdopterin-binding subunit n=1 Tax=Cupriavidus sp. SW-Y-13 TaxID=2653854 RepID=UPI001365E5E2|nr:xanthine dehydrogenase family protein molybdopterin-binding subunit [Cupriavidus sp. SW-Y-13]MWL86429.1 molybdopterin-dependent oxidoreductase [Cupriavidus sp. SW-Y-13]